MIKKMLRPLGQRLEKAASGIPCHPTTLTMGSGLVAAAGLATSTIYFQPVAGWVLFLLAFAFDALDGMVARAKKLVSNRGAFLDGVMDRIVEFLLILTLWMAFSWNATEQWALVFVLFFGTGMTAFVKAYSEHTNVLSHEKAVALPGLLERTERSVLLLVIFLLAILGRADWAAWGLYLAALLAMLTVAQRVGLVLRH